MKDQDFALKKKIAWTMLLLILILITLYVLQPAPSKRQPGLLICTPMPRVRIVNREPSLVLRYGLQWSSNRTLGVYFYNNPDTAIVRHIINTANYWSQFCGMNFKAVELMSSSQIRVTFDSRDYSSAIGIECMQPKYRRSPTMLLAAMDTITDSTLFNRVVLHEFGHALGLEHEMKNPSSNIPWDTAAVVNYYWDHNRWSRDKVMDQVFKRADSIYYTGFDSNSIMIYAVPDTFTVGHYSIEWPLTLSDTDRIAIGKWYPKY